MTEIINPKMFIKKNNDMIEISTVNTANNEVVFKMELTKAQAKEVIKRMEICLE